MQIKNPKDFWAGLMFFVFGVFFLVVAVGTPDFINQMWGEKLIPGYQIGSAVRMGPAYFPVVLGGLMAVLGAIIFFRSFVSHISGEAAALKLPFNILDLAVAAAIFVLTTIVAKALGISNDYAMLASALIISVLAAMFRPETKALALILASSLAFAYLLKPLGLVIASAALIFISAYGGHEFKWKEVSILTVVLVIFSVLVFVKGLTLPFPICPDFIESCPIR
jgi:putative tricarboxylic transport membrane protein